MKKIIYLDWEVMSCLYGIQMSEGTNSLDFQLTRKIECLRKKDDICMPYSISHLNDLLEHDEMGDGQRIYADLELINRITNQTMITEEKGVYYIEIKNAHNEYQIRKADATWKKMVYSYYKMLSELDSDRGKEQGHIEYARFADYFISGDAETLRNLRIMCEDRQLRVNICSIQEFLDAEI